jgi:hypothetical protein
MKYSFVVFIIFYVVIIVDPISVTAGVSDTDDEKSGIIKGKVEDKVTGHPMEFVSIAVFDKLNSGLINGSITDSTGEFEIKGMTYGEYYLVANFIGFEKSELTNIVIDKDSPMAEVGNISLTPSIVELGIVNVVADKNPIEYKLT